MSDLKVHLNGALVPAEQAAVSVDDVGLLHGGSAFTTLAARDGKCFRLDRHIARLHETCELLSLRVGPDGSAEALTAAVGEVLAANGLAGSGSVARIRITLTPGAVTSLQPTTIVTAGALPPTPPKMIDAGVDVTVSSYRQIFGDPTFGYKTGCYFPRVLARKEAHRKQCAEAFWFTPAGHLAEACFMNVFLVKDGRVRTPARDTPCLPGVTRQAVIDCCEGMDIPVDDAEPILGQDVLAAEEIFLTASTTGLLPVVRVERRPIGDETPGPVTRQLRSAYETLVAAEAKEPQS